ncbi:MAG: transposase [Limnochordia bacterium]|nr:transposase [Limnochordia bacterium]
MYQLTQDKRNIQSEVYQEYEKTLNPAQTFPGTSSPTMQEDQWSLSAEGVTQFKVNVYWYAGSWSTMRYTVEYREIGAEEWTRYIHKSQNEWWGSSSGTESHTIDLDRRGNWEVRVVANCSGGSTVRVTSSSYVADEIIWTPVGRQVEYLYQYQDTAGPLAANLASKTVIWKYDERELMAQALTDWCTRAIEAELPSLNRFVRLIERHWEGILNHACHPISNGRLEGTNNKIKVIKRESYGFHDLEYFQLKIKQRCSGKQEKGQHLRR